MMATINFNKDTVEKKLDITYGDLVYLTGDVGLRAGVGIVVSTKRQSFDIYDTPFLHKGCFFIEDTTPPHDSGRSVGLLVQYRERNVDGRL